MSKAKVGVLDFFDISMGLQKGDMSRAHPYETEFLRNVLRKDKIIDRFRSYTGGRKRRKQKWREQPIQTLLKNLNVWS